MVQCNLTNMKNRGMISNIPSDLRGAKVTDVLWIVNPNMLGEFELLPKKSTKLVKATPLPPEKWKSTNSPIPVAVPKQQEIDVESLTLKQAKQLFDKLSEFFG